MLRQGPDKNDVKPCQTWELTTPTWSHVHYQDHESKSRWISAKTRYCLIRVLEFFTSFTRVRTPSPISLSACFHPISMTLLERYPTALKSRTPLVHPLVHFTPFSFTVSRPGATDPRPKHQALAPSLPMWLPNKLMFVTVLLTFNASARACGQQGWQTMWNLRIMRTYNAICDSNIKPCPLPHNWNQQTAEAKIARKHEEIRVNFSWKDVLLLLTGWVYFSSFENALPIPLPSCFYPMFPCEGLLERSTGLTPKHQSTNTAKVSQVLNTTGTPLDSIPVHHCKTWNHRPPCQATGLGSFIANLIV